MNEQIDIQPVPGAWAETLIERSHPPSLHIPSTSIEFVRKASKSVRNSGGLTPLLGSAHGDPTYPEPWD